MLAVVAVFVIAGIASFSKPSRPTSDERLVTFATGLGDQFAWDATAVDQTGSLSNDDKSIGWVTVAASQGSVELRRWTDVATRKAHQPSGDTTVAGCADVTVAFRYENTESAAADALTTTNFLQILNGGDCEHVAETTTTRPPTQTGADRPAPFDLAMNSCATGSFGLVKANGTVRNNDIVSTSYFIEIKIENDAGVRVGYGNGFATAVDPGQTASWSVVGTVDFAGAVTCKYSADPI